MMEQHIVTVKLNNYLICLDGMQPTYGSLPLTDINSRTNTTNNNFVKRHKNSPELSLLKFLPLTYHHSHFLAATLDFTSFFTIAFLRAAHFFYSLAVLD